MTKWVLSILLMVSAGYNIRLNLEKKEAIRNYDNYKNAVSAEVRRHLVFPPNFFETMNWIFPYNDTNGEYQQFFAQIASGKFQFDTKDSFVAAFLHTLDSLDSEFPRKLFLKELDKYKKLETHDTALGHLFFVRYLKELGNFHGPRCGPKFMALVHTNQVTINKNDTFNADIVPFSAYEPYNNVGIYVNGKEIPFRDGFVKFSLTDHKPGFNEYLVEVKVHDPIKERRYIHQSFKARYYVLPDKGQKGINFVNYD